MEIVRPDPDALYVLTGGTGTIGQEVLRQLVGWKLSTVLLMRNPSKPASLGELLERQGHGESHIDRAEFALDLASRKSVYDAANAVMTLAKASGRRIVLVHIAGGVGTGRKGRSWLTSEVFTSNALGPLAMIKQLMPRLAQVVVMSSSGTTSALPWRKIRAGKRPGAMTKYCTAKAAIEAAALLLSEGRFDLRVAVPGVTKGGFFKGRPYVRKMLVRLIYGLLGVAPEDSAGAALRALNPTEELRGKRVVLKGGYWPRPARYEVTDLCPQAYNPEFAEWVLRLTSEFESHLPGLGHE